MGAFTKQPMKGFYTVYFIAMTLLRLPFIYIYYLPRSLRQHPDYSLKVAVWTDVTHILFAFYARVEIEPDTSLEPRKQGDQFIKIDPSAGVEENLYTDICLINKKILPTTIGAVWYPNKPSKEALQDGKVILHFHAGAYVIMSARESGPPAACLHKTFKTPVLCPEYRSASMRDGHGEFPAQLQDAVTAYRYLLREMDIKPSAIIISGDSAGGHLAIMLLRYIASNPSTLLPPPSGAMLFSPWINLDEDPELTALEKNNAQMDLLPDDLFQWALRVFPGGPTPRSNKYIAPLKEPFMTPTPIWLCRSLTERLSAGVKKFATAMEGVGNKIKLYNSPNYPRDILLTADAFGNPRMAQDALADAYTFFQRNAVS